MEGMSLRPWPMRFSESWKMPCSARLMTSSASSVWSMDFGDGELRDVDEAAQQRLVADDANVVLDAGAVGNAVDERGEVGDSADGFDLFAAVEFLGEGDHVDGAAHGLQVAHAGEDAAMRVEREVVGLEFGGLVEEQAVEQDGAEDGALGFDAGGKSAFESVVGGRHREVISG